MKIATLSRIAISTLGLAFALPGVAAPVAVPAKAAVELASVSQPGAVINPQTAAELNEAQAAQSLAEFEQQQEQLRQQRRTQQIDSIIRDSGLLGLSDQIRNLAVATLNQQQAALGYQYQLAAILAERWQPQQWQQRLQQSLQSLDDEALALMQQVLADARLQRGREKEQQALSEQSSDEFQQYVLKLRQQPPAPHRVQALVELDQAMGFSALLIASHQQVYQQLQTLIKDWQPEENWQAQLQLRVQEFLLYAYRRTPNLEINELASLYGQSDLQQWLSSVPAQM